LIYALKLLVFALVAMGATAYLLRPAFAHLFSPQQYKRAWICLLVVTVIAFLSFRVEFFVVLLAMAAIFSARYLGAGDVGKVNAFLLFLVPLPPIAYTVGGLDGLNYVLRLEHVRLLSMVLLTAPALRLLLRQRDRNEPSLRLVDISVFLVQIWSIFLTARYASISGLMREVVESCFDIWVPYYVITRTLRTPAQLREAAAYLMLGCVMVAGIACVESLTQRNLYGGLQWIYGVRWESSVDLRRGGLLRVEATTPQPIVLAFILVFAMGLWTWLRGEESRSKSIYLVYVACGLGLLSTWSRGPWLGAILMGIAFALQRWLSPRAFGVTVILSLIAAVIAKASDADAAIVSALATVFGSTENDLSTITYRRDLLDASIAMIKQSPWMGVPNYETALESFKQGEGIIDLVNSYIVIMINAGAIGLALFLFPYVFLIAKLLGARNRERLVSRNVAGKFSAAFIALILAMLFVMFTASTLDAMRHLLSLGIALPVVWLMQARRQGVVDAAPERRHGARGGLVPGIAENPGLLRR
jgi:O-antigen ligase